nr:ead/Ea22-like family protein [Klebsiella pneumoniae]
MASLGSAGELSIREQKFLKLAKAYQQLAAENVQIKAMNDCLSEELRGYESDGAFEGPKMHLLWWQVETPATDRIVAGIKADGRVEGAHFVANRMLAAWDAGFIEDTAKNAADIARMILASTEFMANAPEGDFDRSFADDILADIAKQLREVDGK